MKNPEINRGAKALAQRLGAKGIIVLAFNDDRFAGVSYGITRAECAPMGRLLDRIGEMIEVRAGGVWE